MGKMSKHKLNVCSAYTEKHQKVLRKQHSLGEENASEGTSELSLRMNRSLNNFTLRGCTNNQKTQKITYQCQIPLSFPVLKR